MTIFFLIVFGGYMLSILVLMYGWEGALAKTLPNSEVNNAVSVIIPFRNEGKSIESLVKSLSGLQYQKEKLEFIFVNDHSSDDSRNRLESLRLPNSRIIDLPDGAVGKKATITKGIEASTNELIITTDADCVHPIDWIHSVNVQFSNPKVNMVIGAVSIVASGSWFHKLQQLEFASLIGSGVSMLFLKMPSMANGANLAFRKKIFLEVNGYDGNEHIASGDDEYLMKKFFAISPDGVVFNNSSNSIVATNPQESVKKLFQQRLRWASKWRHQTDTKIKWVAFSVFVFQAAFVSAFVAYATTGNKLILTLLFIKAIFESVFLFRVCQFLKVRFSFLSFLMLQFLYPIYVMITAIGSLFLPFEWKGRKY